MDQNVLDNLTCNVITLDLAVEKLTVIPLGDYNQDDLLKLLEINRLIEQALDKLDNIVVNGNC